MKCLILVVGLLAPALAGCQATFEVVKAPVCESADPPPVDPAPVVPEPSAW